MQRAVFFFLTLLILSAAPVLSATNEQKCSYQDYDYIPHPDQKIGGEPPRTFRLIIKENSDFLAQNGGIREFYYIDTIDQNGTVQSTVKIPFKCSALGVMHCTLDVKGKSYLPDRLDVAFFENFSSGSMVNRAPYALSIPGFFAATKNTDYAEENILKRPKNPLYMPYFVPQNWVADKKINNCDSEYTQK